MSVRVRPGAPAQSHLGSETIEQLADDFWTFRGSFRVAHVIDIGTQMSLVRRADGSFVLLDSYDLGDDDTAALLALTDGGRAISAILNVHPFHTLHCKAVHALVPHAELIGTRRHREKQPSLPWSKDLIERPQTQQRFADLFDFSIPAGVDFISANENVHVSSVLVRHRQSRIVHVDDTLMVLAAPGLLGRILPTSRLRFHPMLSKGLEKRAGAADDYAGWARSLGEKWADTTIVCAAHSAVRRMSQPDGFRREMAAALVACQATLALHRERYS